MHSVGEDKEHWKPPERAEVLGHRLVRHSGEYRTSSPLAYRYDCESCGHNAIWLVGLPRVVTADALHAYGLSWSKAGERVEELAKYWREYPAIPPSDRWYTDPNHDPLVLCAGRKA